MKLFLIALSLCSIVQLCFSAKPCLSLPPGFDRLSHGIDITSFDLLPSDLTTANGMARNIFDFTCDKGKKWSNPFVPTLVYDLPDQIDSVTTLPGGILDINTEIANNFADTKAAKSNKIGIGLMAGMFSFSHSSAKSMDAIVGRDKILTTVSSHVSAISVELLPYWTETNQEGLYMKEFYDKMLPNTYAENPAKYEEFLSTFGTHYFTNARFGGLMKIEVQTDTNFLNHSDSKSMEFNAGISFMEKLSLSGGQAKSNVKVDDKYAQNSVISESYYGGTANLIQTGLAGFQGWWESAQRVPWIFGGKLVSIDNFFPASPKKNALETAIVVKLDRAYLDELAQSLAVLRQNIYIDVPTATSLAAQVAAQRALPIPNHAAVAQLGPVVEQFVNVNKNKKPYCLIKTTLKNGKVVSRECIMPTGATRCQCTL